MKEWLKAIFILPFNVTIVIPCLILYFTKFRYNLLHYWELIFGILLILLGLSLAIWTMILFHKIGKGTLAPWASTQHLIIEGPYKITRNPMITGILIILFGETLVLNSLYILCWTILFFVINCIHFKLYEEKNLAEKFGDEYLEYKKSVPAWIPKIK